MGYRGVKFYPKTDLIYSTYLRKSVEIIENFDDKEKYVEANKILELYNIKKYFDDGISFNEWTDVQITSYTTIVNKFNKYICQYFDNINALNIEKIICSIDYNYKDDFWKLFDKLKLYKKIPTNVFTHILNSKKVDIQNVLSNKDTVEYYDKEIIQYLLEKPDCAELLLKEYVEYRDKNYKKVYFPDILLNSDKQLIMQNYIQSDQAYPNYLELIYKSSNTKELQIPDTIKLLAKRKYEMMYKEALKRGKPFKIEATIIFNKQQEELIKIEGNSIRTISYCTKWIEENLDYPTLLNNFIYLFKFTDLQCRIQHVHREMDCGITEEFFGVKSNKHYFKGVAFTQCQMIAQGQIQAYYFELKKHKINIEDVLKWFFQEYLLSEFNIKEFKVEIPSSNIKFIEKIRTILPETDNIPRRYKYFVQNREIDEELLEISSSNIPFRNIPSILKNKYIYGNGKEFNTICYNLFNKQSQFGYIEKNRREFNNLYEFLISADSSYDDFDEDELQFIDILLENKYLKLYKDKTLHIDREKIAILKELYENKVLSTYHIKQYDNLIKEFEKSGLIIYESTLLSKPEQEYFNYLLNKAEFNNGLELRNKYLHGSQTSDTSRHEEDYFIILRVIILLIIKINDELCIAQDEEII